VSHAFHPDAEAEYLEAIAYYETRKPGLGAAFIAEVEHVLARVCETPRRYPVQRHPDIRVIRLHRFPFKMLFRERDATERWKSSPSPTITAGPPTGSADCDIARRSGDRRLRRSIHARQPRGGQGNSA